LYSGRRDGGFGMRANQSRRNGGCATDFSRLILFPADAR
jgi:hypothetical protein